MNPIVVVGGGITGSLLAYFLARAGLKVSLLEASGIGSQASGRNPGGLNPLHGPGIPGPLSGLAMRSYRLHLENHRAIRALSEADFHFRTVSRIEVALDEEEAAALKKSFDLYNATEGFGARWLDRAELAAIVPGISNDVGAALLLEGNAMVDGHAYSLAAAQAARTLGASLIEGRATGLRHDGDRVSEVLLERGALACDAVVIANGAWAANAGIWLGRRIAVAPVKGELLLVEWPGKQLTHHVTHADRGVYALPGGRAWLGGTRQMAGFDTEPTRQGFEAIVQGIARFLPAARDAGLIRHVAALRPMTPDGLPLIGRIPGYGNAYVATGGGAKGMLLGIGMAEIVAGLVAGSNPAPSLAAFDPARFQE